MSELTIDEMLEWLDEVYIPGQSDAETDRRTQAIRAILEQHRDDNFKVQQFLDNAANRIDVANLEAIRAFVDRVKLRIDHAAYATTGKLNWGVLDAMLEELAAIEGAE